MIVPEPILIRPRIFQSFPQLFAAESTRHGGVSKPPFQSLNLGNFTEDNEAHILENRRRVLLAAGFKESSLVFARQVHGADVYTAKHGGLAAECDALITTEKGLLLGITVADCAPVLIYDSKNEAVAAAHAGWKGTVAGVVRNTLTEMHSRFGTVGKNCFAYIGTCIDECDFEVGEEVAVHFESAFRKYYPSTKKVHVNLKAANCRQLLDFGIPEVQIEISPRSTFTDVEKYFSYRAENGKTGRFMGMIGMYP
jgi:YfiH family protein